MSHKEGAATPGMKAATEALINNKKTTLQEFDSRTYTYSVESTMQYEPRTDPARRTLSIN